MENSYSEKTICVVGGGLVGSLLSLRLAQRGFKVDLFEKRADMRSANIAGGRTIAMSISDRGWRALEMVDLKDAIKPNTVPKYSRKVHTSDTDTIVQSYGKPHQALYTINRKYLNSVLLDAAEKTNRVRCFFNSECTFINYDTGEINFRNSRDESVLKQKYDHIIGADGVFSKVAEGIKQDKNSDCSFFSPEYGYKELVIQPNQDGNWQMQHDVVHVWPRGHSNLVALPNTDKSFTCTLFLKFDGEISLNALDNHELVNKFFEKNFNQITKFIPDYANQFLINPISKIFSLKCYPWHYKRKTLLIGDASHAIAPFFAMGMNTGFEDCTVFDNFLNMYDNDIDKVFEEFPKVRKIDTDAIADMSLENFKALGHSNDKYYDLKWNLSMKLWEKYPDVWMPLYPMIAFSHIPLSEVKARSEYQKNLLEHFFKNKNITSVNEFVVTQFFNAYLKEAKVLEPVHY
ncbi:MAG: FAD-dependent monooxygenase [Bacteroidales bacterium]|nr:FAD-dependent monooxygenase [Bacteroidales bacterium]